MTKRTRGNWCGVCQVTHPMSQARGAVPGECQSCDTLTTDIRLIPVTHEVERDAAMKRVIDLVLLCTPCVRRGVRVRIEEGKATVEKVRVA